MKRFATIAISVFASGLAPLRVLAQSEPPSVPPPDYYWHGPGRMVWDGGYGWNGGYGWPFWEMVPMLILVIVLVCVLVVYLVKTGGGQHPWGAAPTWGDSSHSALQILNERFAKGEIQKDEYEDRKNTILSDQR